MFKVEKIDLETLINALIELHESGVDFVDLASDNSDPNQDKLVIFTKDDYINPEFYNEERLENFGKEERNSSIIETKKLSDDDIESLL